MPVKERTPSYPTLQMLKSAVTNGELGTVKVFGGTDQMQRIARQALRNLAESRGIRPKAFFPEDRWG